MEEKQALTFAQFKKNIFSEMRVVVLDDVVKGAIPLTNETLTKAITMNENIKTLGFTLKPKDIVRLSQNEDLLANLYITIKSFVPDVKAKPMYPNFPIQVMEMDEAQYRLHQMIHYFSTYGIEALTVVEELKGWLPSVADSEKTEEDVTLLKVKVIDLLSVKEVVERVKTKIACKTERYTIPERDIVRWVAHMVNLVGEPLVDITFKENISVLVDDLFESRDLDDVNNARMVLQGVSKHSGDVLDFTWSYIAYHEFQPLRTSQKRAIVKCLEYYTDQDFRSNLALKRKRNLTVLRYLSFNRLSVRGSHKEAVVDLRADAIKTWNSQLEERIREGNIGGILDFAVQRPTILLRITMRLLSLGVPLEKIRERLISKTSSLNMQTLMSVYNWSLVEYEYALDKNIAHKIKNMKLDCEELVDMQVEKNYNKKQFSKLLKELIIHKMGELKTPFASKKVYVDSTIFDLHHSYIETNDKSEEGGYIRSGLAIKIPENVDRLRFFVYWNDKRIIDIDLHSDYLKASGDTGSVGWNAKYKEDGIVMSGDITHSDATEYIDIDIPVAISNTVVSIENRIVSYTGENFKNIDEVFTGMMAVESIGDKTILHNSKNTFFRHDLQSDINYLQYCNINLVDRYMKLVGHKDITTGMTMFEYIDYLLLMQNAIVVTQKENADIVLSLDKTADENNISLIDENYYMDSDK